MSCDWGEYCENQIKDWDDFKRFLDSKETKKEIISSKRINELKRIADSVCRIKKCYLETNNIYRRKEVQE